MNSHERIMSDTTPACNVICLKWGTRYPAEYTNRLYRAVKKNLSRPFRFLCVTDDPTGLAEGIEAAGIASNPGYPDSKWPNLFLKLCLFKDGFADLQGPTLFCDVDLIIMRNIDCFFDYKPGKNCIIHNWLPAYKTIFRKRPHIGNSSFFRFEAGKSNYIYETFLREFAQANDQSLYPTEQAFMTHAMGEVYWWPEEWVRSYKRHCRPCFPFNMVRAPQEPDTKVLVFHGLPDPDQAIAGFDDGVLHHRTLPAPWIARYWE